MAQYRLSSDAKMDLARIYWRGVGAFGELQAERYYEAFFRRFDEIAESPFKYQAVDHVREGYRRSVCGAGSIYFRVVGGIIEIMRILGRQDATETLTPAP